MPIAQRILRGLARLNAAYPWSHNAHYHRWILRQLPRRLGTALDVGSGTGDLARLLAGRAAHVHGIDADPAMAAAARAATPPGTAAEFTAGDALTDLPPGPFDAVTCVAVLHHLPLEQGLVRLRDHLAPGGTLVVVGLAADRSPAGFALDLLSVALNPLVGMVRNRGRRGSPQPDSMSAPTAPASTTLAEVRARARRLLPGARVRRGLFWRYTLVWRRPA